MKAAKKMSRNQARKAAYSAMANKDSRHQDALEKPIIGRFEERSVIRTCPKCFNEAFCVTDCTECGGTGKVHVLDQSGRMKMQRVLVHDGKV